MNISQVENISIVFIFVICGLLITVKCFYISVTVHNLEYH